MTLERLTLWTVLGMLGSGATVYAVTAAISPPATEASAPTAAAPQEVSSSSAAPRDNVPAPTLSATAPLLSSPAPGPSEVPSSSVSLSPTSTDVSPTGSTVPTARPLAPSSPTIDPLFATAYGGLLQLAATETSGMRTEGPPLVRQMREGAVRTQPVQLEPGKCYAAVAFAAGITRLDLSMNLAIPGQPSSPLVLGVRRGSGVVFGGQGNCHTWTAPLPVAARLTMMATAGSGVAVAQLYVR